MSNSIIKSNNINLPNTVEATLPEIDNIMKAFNLPREILAGNDEINYVWKELPRELSKIPQDLRNGLIVRMCVAISVGLFDGAINYVWNAVIIALKHKVKNFGLSLVAQTL